MARFLKALDFTTHTEDSGAPAPSVLAVQDDCRDHNHGTGQLGAAAAPAAFPVSILPSEHSGKLWDAHHAKAIRLLWCDTAGIRRCRVIPVRRYSNVQACGLGITTACMAMPAYADCPAPHSGLSAVGEARIRPIDSTRVALPWCPGHQMALVEFDAPRSETPWDCCPRRALRNTCEMLQENFGLTMKVGFELEFLLLERMPSGETGLLGSTWRPVDNALYCQSSALDQQAKVLDEMIESLEEMGIEVVQWHAESAAGQFEIALMHGDPIDSADKLLLAKEALVGVAGSHGLAVSFLPKSDACMAGNGMHVHFSLWKDGRCHMHDPHGGGSFTSNGLEAAAAAVIAAAVDLTPLRQQTRNNAPSNQAATSAAASTAASHGLPPAPDAHTYTQPEQGQHLFGFRITGWRQSSAGEKPEEPAATATATATAGPAAPAPQPVPSVEMLSFLAGILYHMDVLLPFTAPSPNSYDRLRPGAWAGAHAAWGYNNREVPLRVTAPGPNNLDMMHVEYKALDGTANPYIALSAIIVAGMLGIFAKMFPPEPCQVPPGELDKEAASRLGVRLLPGSLNEALGALKKTRTGETFKEALAEAIGQPLLQAFLAVREAEADYMPCDRSPNLLLRYS